MPAPLFVNAPGKEFADGVSADPRNKVTEVASKKYPNLSKIQVGMTIKSLNGTTAMNAMEELARYKDFPGEILVVFALEDKARDEFDLSSDDDVNDTFQPPSRLAPLPPEIASSASSSAQVVFDAAKKVAPGKCIVIMSEGANPALPISIAAEKAKCDVMYIDTVARLKTRQRIDDAGELYKRSLEKGLWIYLEQATKSITLLEKLSESILFVEAAGKMHPQSRVFLMCEPHPHFPAALMKGCVTLRSRLQGSPTAVDLKEDLMESKRKMSYIHGTNSADAPPEITKTKKKVKVSSEVKVVHLEKSAFMEMSASAQPTADRENAVGEGLRRVAKYTFGANEKFISLCKVHDHRFAVGTNSGYVVLLDGDGLPLIQFRPHKACIWDVSFSSSFDFATACEDGTSTIYNYSLMAQELTATSVASFQSDVFAVTYANDRDVNSAVLSGGLSATVCILHSDRHNSSFIASGTSIQAMRATDSKRVILGGGSGACTLIDSESCRILDVTNKHPRKVPAVACHGDTAITGGFDRVVRLWDTRNGFAMTVEKTIDEVVTAVALNDRFIAACSGSDLLIWDVRKIANPLAKKQNAWKDLTRGLVIDGNLVVTASVDGVARYWEIN